MLNKVADMKTVRNLILSISYSYDCLSFGLQLASGGRKTWN